MIRDIARPPQSLVGKTLRQNAGMACIQVIQVISVKRDVALVRAKNLRTGATGRVKIDLCTGNELYWHAENPWAFKGSEEWRSGADAL